MSILHSSTRRPSPLRDVDYDHEINLIDRTRSRSASPPRSPGVLSDSSSRRHSDTPLRKHHSLRKEITKRKFSKYQDRHLDGLDDRQAEDSRVNEETAEERGRPRGSSGKDKQHKNRDSAIDILYENQRGGFLCGISLFSGRALGNLDPSPWTNEAQKTSATNITNAQVPDPSWQWAWKEWSVNHQEEVDEDGWEYSFAFSKKFSWHGPSWWNSFVRRRAWIRKRVKRHTGYRVQEGHMLNSDYFTIHSAKDRSRSRTSTLDDSAKNRYSRLLARREMEENAVMEDICDIGSLMRALKFSRIDREKMEAVGNFIEHGGDELYYLRERMHDIMGTFIFQASRRLLLSHLLKIFNEAVDERKSNAESGKEPDPAQKRRLENLEAALQHADEEVKRLEFWSDVKDMAEKGETKGAVDESQGWDKTWTGLDSSAPKDVISDRNLPGTHDCKKGEGNGTAILDSEKGKGVAS
jgi:hypothetical protein